MNRTLANALVALNAAPLKFEMTEIGNLLPKTSMGKILRAGPWDSG